jgi:uncharacterized protein YdeI (YjbR/CyaY-like superfamily)
MPALRKAPNVTELPVKGFRDAEAWTEWLGKHHEGSAGLWLSLARKSTGTKSLTYPEALDVALCYGWIDGQRKSKDTQSWLVKFTPRGPRSIWSKINRTKVQALIKEGRMQPAGLAAIERAKSDGRWAAAYDSWSSASIPVDLATELERSAKARAFFDSLNSRNRYAILFRIQTAKKPETRQRRIREFVRMLARGEKLYP